MPRAGGISAERQAAPEARGVGGWASALIEVAAVIGFLALCMLLIPFGLVTVFFSVQVWQLAVTAVVGVAISAIVHRATNPRAGVHVLGIVAAIVGWVCAFVLAGWDTEGRLSDRDEPLVASGSAGRELAAVAARGNTTAPLIMVC